MRSMLHSSGGIVIPKRKFFPSKTLMTHPLHYASLEAKLGYSFRHPAYLEQALTHRSFSSSHNERLEFIGDAILNYAVTHMLFLQFPKEAEGRLSKMRAMLVNQSTLCQIAESLDLGKYLYLGPGEIKANGHTRPSILSDALEALFAAISLDSSFQNAEEVIHQLYKEKIKSLPLQSITDAKSLLQEVLQARQVALPCYRVLQQFGQAHQKVFQVECAIPELNIITQAEATSRKKAEQEAAGLALKKLSSFDKYD